MRRRLDADNAQLNTILSELLAQDVDITIREVARRHPTIKNASAFVRDEERVSLIQRGIEKQNDARAVVLEPHKLKAASLTEQLIARDQEITQLKDQIKALVTSHAACVRAVMAHGGMPALERFWKDYRAVGNMVRELHATPTGADVVNLPVLAKKGRK
ncbi:hypothetical protein D3C87_1034950 [compost metagenome]